jgi:hypothetical protein
VNAIETIETEKTKISEEYNMMKKHHLMRSGTNCIVCKMQYKFVGFVENNFVGKPTFLFSTFGV